MQKLFQKKRMKIHMAAVVCAIVILFVFGKFAFFLFKLGKLVVDEFPRNQGLPSGIYARPLELYQGLDISPEDLALELKLLQFRKRAQIDTSGSFSREDGIFIIFSRAFHFGNSTIGPRQIRVEIKKNQIESIMDLSSGKPINQFCMEPLLIGHLSPSGHKNKGFVKIEEMPRLLIETIISVEDRDFYAHHGVDFSALFRAMMINMNKGRVVQGGSTITQQLARHLFFSRKQTIKRKLDEIFMALLLEFAYGKKDILETYINEVYLGQDGNRPIRGFSEAGRFYFSRDIRELTVNEIALLVGMLKGPSRYHPVRHPRKARHRRTIVLNIMAQRHLITHEQAMEASKETIEIHSPETSIRFPAFIDLVRRRFLKFCSEKDSTYKKLYARGARIFTSCDPIVQLNVEKAIASGLDSVESQHKIESGELETGVVVVSASGCDVLAVVGGRHVRFDGFNRALDARRPVGSLIKPVYFLAALEHPDSYNLMTLIDDSAFEVPQGNRDVWTPRNFTPRYNGKVPLYRVLSQSLNAASVRLGMALGLDTCCAAIRRLGFKRDIPVYPSTLLGSISMSPVEVAGMYHTFSSGGFIAPVRVIHGVCDRDGKLLKQFPLTLKKDVQQGPVYLLNVILRKAFAEGAKGYVDRKFLKNCGAAGKTGTTDDLRDSWFAGFTGDKLAVVWVGKDDFGPGRLTGAQGAFKLWEEIMRPISHKPFNPSTPDTVEWIHIDPDTGFKVKEKDCEASVSIPYITGYGPKHTIACDDIKKTNETHLPFKQWLEKVFQ